MCRVPGTLIAALVLALASAGQAEALRDPTRPDRLPPRAAPSQPRFELSAIFYSESRRVAVLNGRTVVEGDRVSEARIVGIRPDALELEYRGRRITVMLARARIRD